MTPLSAYAEDHFWKSHPAADLPDDFRSDDGMISLCSLSYVVEKGCEKKDVGFLQFQDERGEKGIILLIHTAPQLF